MECWAANFFVHGLADMHNEYVLCRRLRLQHMRSEFKYIYWASCLNHVGGVYVCVLVCVCVCLCGCLHVCVVT